MGVRFLPDRRRFPRGPTAAADADVTAWVAAVVTNGGTVSAGRTAIVTTFVQAEKAAGTWQLTDDYWPLWAENAPQALTSLKQRRLATVTAAPTFTADRGYAFNGTTNYINTNWLPSTMGIAMTGSEQRLAAYERTDVSSTGYTMGTISVSTRQMWLRARNGTVMGSALNNASANYTLAVADSRGWSSASRAGGGTTQRGFKNGVAMADATGLTVANSITSPLLIIGATGTTTTPTNFRAASVGFACVGAPLSDAQEAAQYANVQAWATAIGANV